MLLLLFYAGMILWQSHLDALRMMYLREYRELELQIEIFAWGKNKKDYGTTQDNGPFPLFSKCICVNATYFVPVCSSTYLLYGTKNFDSPELTTECFR